MNEISDYSLYLLMGAVIRSCLIDYTTDIESKINQYRKNYEKIDNGKVSQTHESILKQKEDSLIKNKEDAKFFFESDSSWFKLTNINLEYLLKNKERIINYEL